MDNFKKMSLKKSLFIVIVFLFVFVLVLSTLTILPMAKIQRKIVENRVISIQLHNPKIIDNGEITYSLNNNELMLPFTAKQNIMYYGSIILMILLPVLYVIVGIAFSAKYYYKIKLQKPILLLKNGISNVTKGNLDFEMIYKNTDELGELCSAMEIMRKELRNDKKRIADLISDKKVINASMSHDLGTPITVIKGYIDYLRKGILQDLITEDNLIETLGYMSESAERLEKYVNCVRDIQRLDDIEVTQESITFNTLYKEIESNVNILVHKHNKEINLSTNIEKDTSLFIDRQAVFRVWENVIKNALRYAQNKIQVTFSLQNELLKVSIIDDGPGFSNRTLESCSNMLFVTDDKINHFGIGLTISRVICKKHGGNLYISNYGDGGGTVLFCVKVEND